MLYRTMVEKAGAIYNGVQKYKDERLILFTDPMTKTTIGIDAKVATVSGIKVKLYHARDLFKKYAAERRK